MKRRILILDDDMFFVDSLRRTCEEAGWVLCGAGQESDLVLIDPAFMENRGYSLLIHLREEAGLKALPLLVLSGSGSLDVRALLEGLGFTWVLKSRLVLSDLPALMETVLEKAAVFTGHSFSESVASAMAGSSQQGVLDPVSIWMLDSLFRVLCLAINHDAALEGLGVYLMDHFPVPAVFFRGEDQERAGMLRIRTAGGFDPGPYIALATTTLGLQAAPPVELMDRTATYPRGAGPTGNLRFQCVLEPSSGPGLCAVLSVQDPYIEATLARLMRAAAPVLAAAAAKKELAGKVENTFKVFSRFLPVVVIEDLLRKSEDASLLTGETRQIVALFSHIADFAEYEELNKPEDLVRFLNRHFSLYSRIIRKHGGTINKYIGDAVFAIFGAPTSYLDNALRALHAVTEIQEELSALSSMDLRLPAGGYRAGIGLNTGTAIVGNIGSRDSFDYTAIGDTINLAARLESLCKFYHVPMLFSEAFRDAARKDAPDLEFRLVDRARVKGKAQATAFYTLEPAEAGTDGFLSVYHKGMAMFRLGNWNTALDLFRQAADKRRDDYLVRLFIQRSEEYIRNPPQDWNGAVSLQSK